MFDDLAFSIVLQAIDDYRLMKHLGIVKMKDEDGQVISKKEIAEFFNSDWCDSLLGDMNVTGKDILRILNR